MSGRYVAIDGGNSKTHVVLGSTTGEVLALRSGPGSSPHLLGVPGSLALLTALVADAVAAAGLPAGTQLDRAEVYLASADLPVEVDVLTKAAGEAGWAREYRVDNDLFALLRAGTSSADAVAVVCGAGINGVGRTADGRTARFPRSATSLAIGVAATSSPSSPCGTPHAERTGGARRPRSPRPWPRISDGPLWKR
jgi:N-acetylglucosamine kinase-like BadF-type ATPase